MHLALTRLRLSYPAGATLALALGGCVSDADTREPGAMAGEGGGGMTGDGGASGSTSGASGASAGGSEGGTGGATGGSSYQDDPTFGTGFTCGTITGALITDFTPPAPPAGDAGAADATAPPPTDTIAFGDFTATFSGGTFQYPGDGAYAVNSDVSGGDWHLTGDIGTYSGFGIFFAANGQPDGGACVLDASAYRGISFTVSGSVAMGDVLTLTVGTSANDVSHLWLNAVVPGSMALPNNGRCIPAGNEPGNQFDGSCGAASFSVPVTGTPTTIEVLWTDLTGGTPSASVEPTEITGFAWAFPAPPGAGTDTPTPYAADVVIDDLSFIE